MKKKVKRFSRIASLQSQISELTMLVELKDKRIADLETLLDRRIKNIEERLATMPFSVPLLNPVNAPVGNCLGGHDFPSPWHSVIPPSCRRCGVQAPSWVVTSTSIVGSTTNVTIPNQQGNSTDTVMTSGYAQILSEGSGGFNEKIKC